MAKEIAISKKIKINQAQQTMIMAVFGASVVFGVCLALVINFVGQISFNSKVLTAEEVALKNYSATISNIGVCKTPKNKDGIYTDEELKNCKPNSISALETTGSLRYNILARLVKSENLSSVARIGQNGSSDLLCKNGSGSNYTYSEMYAMYSEAKTDLERTSAMAILKRCSSLRTVADALPSTGNNTALQASLELLFSLSGRSTEGVRVQEETEADEDLPGLGSITLKVPISTISDIELLSILRNMENSIREFAIKEMIVEWGLNDTLDVSLVVTSYYVSSAQVVEESKTILANPEDAKNKKETSK